MGEQQDNARAGFARLASAVRQNAKTAAAFIGALGTAIALVFNAGRQVEDMKARIQTNHVEIQLLREEVRLLESALLLPRKATP